MHHLQGFPSVINGILPVNPPFYLPQLKSSPQKQNIRAQTLCARLFKFFVLRCKKSGVSISNLLSVSAAQMPFVKIHFCKDNIKE